MPDGALPAFAFEGVEELKDPAHDEQNAEENDADLRYIKRLPEYDSFRSDPKCMALLKKMGLPED